MQQEIFDLIESIYFIDFFNHEENKTEKLLEINLKIDLSLQLDYIDAADFELKVS
jgi:hypothetical protein